MTAAGDIRAALVLLAAGSGSRVGHETNKVFLQLAGQPVLTWSLSAASRCAGIVRVVLVVADRDRGQVASVLADRPSDAFGGDIEVVIGGATRHDSEWSALSALADGITGGSIDVVVVHDAARPLASPDAFASVIDTASRIGGALPVRARMGLISLDGSAPPDRLVAVQTPQAFRALPLLRAYTAADGDGFTGTDTASCLERYSDLVIRCVPGSADNLKITFAEDLHLAERLLARAHQGG